MRSIVGRFGIWAVVLWSGAHLTASTPDLRVVEAVKSRDTSAVSALLKQHVDANAVAPDGATALHWAAHLDDVAAADLLMRAGALANVANEYGVTPLILACENGSAAMVQRLLQGGASPNVTMPSGETALMTAARTGNLAAVNALIAGGANVDARESLKGQNALMWALAEQHVDVTRALIDHGADFKTPSKSGFTPLLFAARAGSLGAVRQLVARGADVNSADPDGITPLHVATLRGHLPLAKLLLDMGANPNAMGPGYTPLHYAAGKWDGVDAHDYLDAPGEWNILLGLRPADKLDLIKALFAHGADPNLKMTREPPRYGFSLVSGSAKRLTAGGTAFYLAAMSADLEVMRLLVAGGADPKITSRNGSSALMVAAGMGWMDNETLPTEHDYLLAVDLCLEMGLDVTAVNDSGETALHGTIQGGFDQLVQRLVEKGANVNAKTRRGDTALKIAMGYSAAGGNHVRESTAAVLRKLGGVAQ